MRDLIISISCLLILIESWCAYSTFASNAVTSCCDVIDTQLLPAVNQENWDAASAAFTSLEKKWHTYRTVSYYFLSTDSVNEADETIAKSRYYIVNQDASNSSGEIACFRGQLRALYEKEIPIFSNIL